MAFRSEDQDYRWPHPDHGRDDRRGQTARDRSADSLSLQNTLRELAVTIAGFVGIIALIVVAVSFLR